MVSAMFFGKLYDECLPLTVTRTKQCTPRKPRITRAMLTSIKNVFNRDYLKKKTHHATVKYKNIKIN